MAIYQRIMLIDFIVLQMSECDTIFGIDWMIQHGALKDSRMMKV